MQKFIEEKCGIALSEEKAYLIESRLSRLLIDSNLTCFEELYQRISVSDDPNIVEKVIDAITTNETLWFRDRAPWCILEEQLLPTYVEDIRDGRRNKVRIWSAACSTGQEPYSIAMCIDNYLRQKGINDINLSQFEIIATDISSTVLQIARMGRYDNISITRGLDNDYKENYFKSEGRVWVLDEKIKNLVSFRQFNLQSSFFLLGKFEVIFSRNVLVYFSEKLKKEVVKKMALALQPQGIFIIGSSELFIDHKEYFEMENCSSGVYYKLKKGCDL